MPPSTLAASALADLDVVPDPIDDLQRVGELEVGLELALERAHELLLARHAVEVGVRVAEADVVERLTAAQQPIAWLQIDRLVALGPPRTSLK